MEYKEFATQVAAALGIEKNLPETFDNNFQIKSAYGDFKVSFWYDKLGYQYCEVYYGKKHNGRGFSSNYRFSVATDISIDETEKVYAFSGYPESNNFDPEMVIKEDSDAAYFYEGDDIAKAIARASIATRQ